ncbi:MULTISPECIES: SMI1/KNR4 family protein [Kitasatospora]|uniref:ABM domain-containing protein n=1 Tax=Kitasatospora setae (strain ATCC 33774 / DSM 43861 / JCM 3304 / KCC A-0304 / NBRC 14216 / KM-6054) TaxID=452652 RepID=E4N6E3_KITSK|nr:MULTISPECIES: SMI1/KNR4 family protein [Kitasatospora]BAJ26774.1 hypothetical protein KSE_09370 [Kitasatospora setae KM-6054]
MNEPPVPPVAASWRRIDAWPPRHAPASLALLRPPATPGAPAAAERVLGRPLPAELRESLGCHDGVREWATLLPEQSPLSGAGIAGHWRMCMDVAAENDGLAVRPRDDEPWWHPDWLPWAETADGRAHVLDLRPGPEHGRLGWAGWAGHSGGGDFTDPCPGLLPARGRRSPAHRRRRPRRAPRPDGGWSARPGGRSGRRSALTAPGGPGGPGVGLGSAGDGSIGRRGERVSGEGKFSVYGRLTALPGRRDELVAALLEGLRAGGESGGLVAYSINTALDDPDAVWLTQLWTDQAAHDATTRSEPVAAATRRVAPLLARRPEGAYGHAVHTAHVGDRATGS